MFRGFWVVLLLGLTCCVFATSGAKNGNQGSTATEIRLMDPGWWPTKATSPRDQYVGSAACGRCHKDIIESQSSTPMARALRPATGDAMRFIRTPMHFRTGVYDYELARTPAGAAYSVTNGQQSAAVNLGWVFGDRQFGDTFLFQQEGTFFESRVSYYSAPDGLDFTTGSPRFPPNRIGTALGRRMSPEEPPLCFGCHATAANTDNQFHPEKLIPGVTCEACHGPGAQHVAQMSLDHDEQTPTLIFNPVRLSPSDSVDFCGACHRTSVDVSLSGVSGILSLRFPAYRLQRSRCWGTGDSRLTCIACHDTHRPRQRDAAFYDKDCLSCHSARGLPTERRNRPGRACPVADKLCVSCHMPRYTIPEMHTSFTDHKIAIHRTGDQFAE
jgi:hypothetical protein